MKYFDKCYVETPEQCVNWKSKSEHFHVLIIWKPNHKRHILVARKRVNIRIGLIMGKVPIRSQV